MLQVILVVEAAQKSEKVGWTTRLRLSRQVLRIKEVNRKKFAIGDEPGVGNRYLKLVSTTRGGIRTHNDASSENVETQILDSGGRRFRARQRRFARRDDDVTFRRRWRKMRFRPYAVSFLQFEMILGHAVIPRRLAGPSLESFDGVREARDDDDVVFVRQTAVVDGRFFRRAFPLRGSAFAEVTDVTVSGVDADDRRLFTSVDGQVVAKGGGRVFVQSDRSLQNLFAADRLGGKTRACETSITSDKCQKWRSIEDVYAHVEAHHRMPKDVLEKTGLKIPEKILK